MGVYLCVVMFLDLVR